MQKKLCLLLVTFFLMSSATVTAQETQGVIAPEQLRLYVSVQGNDNGDGSQRNPFKTISRAQEEVRRNNQNMSGDITVVIGGGTYYLTETLKFDNRDSATNGYRITYRAAEGEKPILSGGVPITGFTEGENGIWEAKVEGFDHIRDLTVNGKAALMAQSEAKFQWIADYDDPSTDFIYDGIILEDKEQLGTIENIEDAEAWFSAVWTDNKAKLVEIRENPDNESQAILILQKPWYPLGRINGMSQGSLFPFIIANAYEFLDMPNEFYYNRKTKTLYYMPEEGMDMKAAQIEAAVLEELIFVEGETINNHVENLTFDGLTFRSLLNKRYRESGHVGGQAASTIITEMYGYDPAAIRLNKTTDVHIKNCVFTSVAGFGIDIENSVYGTEISGNLMYDIGSGAIVVGRSYHAGVDDYGREAIYPDGPTPVSWMKPMNFSSLPADYRNMGAWRGRTAASESAYTSEPTWGSYFLTSLDEVKAGKKGWLTLDLEEPYLIDRIEIRYGTYEEYDLDEAGRRNFEILLSNDPEFNEYTVLHTQGNISMPRTSVIQYEGKERFRYVMIRKTVAEQLVMGYFEVFSYDEPSGRFLDPCQNIRIDNNCITRIGTYNRMMPAITAYYLDTLTIEHNNITHVPYSGISMGWGWNRNLWQYVAKNYTVKGNYIFSWNEECYDGGALYMLGHMPNSVVTENYFVGGSAPYGAIYYDSGSSYIESYHNVLENGSNAILLGGTTNLGSTAHDNWGNMFWVGSALTGGGAPKVVEETGASVEQPIRYVAGSEQPEARRIKELAGLEPSYKHLLEKIPDNRTSYEQSMNGAAGVRRALGSGYATIGGTQYQETLEYALEHASFGFLPGQYDTDLYFMLSKMLIERKSEESLSDVEILTETLEMMDVANQVEDHKIELSYEDMLQYCQDMANGAVVGKRLGCYDADKVKDFEESIQKVVDSKDKSYASVVKLEQALQTFYNSGRHAEVLGAAYQNIPAEIDRDSKVITFFVMREQDKKAMDCEFLLSNNASIHLGNAATLDLTKEKTIAVYHKQVSNPQIWKVRAEVKVQDAMWVNKDDKQPLEKDGQLLFEGNPMAYFYTAERFVDSLECSFKANDVAFGFGVSLIVGAETPYIWSDGTDAKDDHYRINVHRQKITLSKVKNGKETVLSSVKVDALGDLQNLKLVTEGRVLKAYYQGNLILQTLLSKEIEGTYAGIHIREGSLQTDGFKF